MWQIYNLHIFSSFLYFVAYFLNVFWQGPALPSEMRILTAEHDR